MPGVSAFGRGRAQATRLAERLAGERHRRHLLRARASGPGRPRSRSPTRSALRSRRDGTRRDRLRRVDRAGASRTCTGDPRWQRWNAARGVARAARQARACSKCSSASSAYPGACARNQPARQRRCCVSHADPIKAALLVTARRCRSMPGPHRDRSRLRSARSQWRLGRARSRRSHANGVAA